MVTRWEGFLSGWLITAVVRDRKGDGRRLTKELDEWVARMGVNPAHGRVSAPNSNDRSPRLAGAFYGYTSDCTPR